MKKTVSIFMAIIMIFTSFCAFALDINMAYYDFKTAHPDFVKSLIDNGLTEGQIIAFIYDVYEYLKVQDSATPVTEENFETFAVDAIFEVSSQEEHYPVQDTLLILYPDAIKLAITQNVVHDDFKPLVETIKKILFSSDEFGNTTLPGNENTDPSPAPPVTTQIFTDIDTSHWAYTAVTKLAENFILNGYLDGSFKPDNNITRAEFAKIIVSATNTYDYTASCSFSDVSSDDWYYAYVATAYKLGYITGYPDGSFHPEDNITRADICTIVGRATGNMYLAPGSSVAAFSDHTQIPEYAYGPVITLTSKGIINGYEDGSFRPLNYATRAQTAKIIFSAFFQK